MGFRRKAAKLALGEPSVPPLSGSQSVLCRTSLQRWSQQCYLQSPVTSQTGASENKLDVRTGSMNPYDELERRARETKSLADAVSVLEILLSEGYAVWTDGRLYEIRQLVARVNGLRIEVFSKEHAPPHFHVTSADIDAVFTVADGTFVRGTIDGRSRKLVEWWYARARAVVVSAWNESRPSDCPVGPVT